MTVDALTAERYTSAPSACADHGATVYRTVASAARAAEQYELSNDIRPCVATGGWHVVFLAPIIRPQAAA